MDKNFFGGWDVRVGVGAGIVPGAAGAFVSEWAQESPRGVRVEMGAGIAACEFWKADRFFDCCWFFDSYAHFLSGDSRRWSEEEISDVREKMPVSTSFDSSLKLGILEGKTVLGV